MTGKDLLENLDNMTLCVNLGSGDTVFRGQRVDGVYFIDFNLLDAPVEPGEEVELKTVKSAPPYLTVTFSNVESLGVFSEFVEKFYQFIQNTENKEREEGNVNQEKI